MDQAELHRLERRCIQEEEPECTSGCPLHVDARAFVGHMASARWNDARKVLQKTMPFPGILGRICDAPCRRRCKRAEVEQAIEIGQLERACVARPFTPPRLPPLPARPQKVAVLGGGLSSLTVAWDLARKGYKVTLFEPEEQLGAGLLRAWPGILNADLVAVEVAPLQRMNVVIELGWKGDPADLQMHYLTAFDAVYLGLDGLGLYGLEEQWHALAAITPGAQAATIDGLYAGGCGEHSRNSPVWQAAEGRWAATSIDRFLQKVSAGAGREKEGPFESRLFTRVDPMAAQPAVVPSDPQQGYNEDEARREALRCLQCECLECVKVCPYLESFGAYPKKYARYIYNNESIVMGSHQANKLINSCSLCGLCEAVCPNDFAMQTVCLNARQELVRRGKMPPSAHEFALLDLEFARSERFALARHAPGRDTSAFVFFPGCQLCATSPGQVERVYDFLRAQIVEGVGLMLGCCAAPAQWAGKQDLFTECCDAVRRQWRSLGEPTLITACSTCHRMFSQASDPLPVTSLWEVLQKYSLPPETTPVPERQLAVHDPCTTRDAPQIQNAVRQLLAQKNVTFSELTTGREYTECCGFGGLMENANFGLARETVRRRAAQSEQDYLAYCAMCRDALAAVGKRCLHLLDLLFPSADELEAAVRPRTGWTRRQTNREQLRARLLKSLWKEETTPMQEPHRAIRLMIAPEVAQLLEQRRILEEDIQKTILHAETTGQKLVRPDNGHLLASFKPFNAFFWVEYLAGDGGYEVFNAYTHRMEACSA